MNPETILFRSVYGDDGIFGNIASISSTFVFMFILFGAFLLKSGAGDFVIDLARSAAFLDRDEYKCVHSTGDVCLLEGEKS